MPRWLVPILLMTTLLALSACQLADPKAKPGISAEEPAASAITSGEIEVTALDDAPTETAQKPTVPEAGLPQDKPGGTEAAAVTADTPADPAPEDVPAAEVAPKSAAQMICEKQGGRWASFGNGLTRTCVKVTKDAGKRCTGESQCESQCLARSGTCAPFKPLLGCNEVLQDNGARVTLCIDG